MRQSLYTALWEYTGKPGRAVAWALSLLIFVAIAAFAVETTPVGAAHPGVFRVINSVLFALFGLEYLLRLYAAPDRWRFLFSFTGMVDLLVVVGYGGVFMNVAFLRGFRILRILQVMRLVRYNEVMGNFMRAFRAYRDELSIFVVTLSLVLLFSSSILYELEHTINPAFASLPDALWWAIVTISTVGYGDVVPMTVIGKVFGALIIIIGLSTMAIMTAIITKVFLDHFFSAEERRDIRRLQRKEGQDAICPHCGLLKDASQKHPLPPE
ncbi:ion transporter [Candidatus Peribacteria bacterium]|nr:ion transporter [Candidatus Peribacteria bacterium]